MGIYSVENIEYILRRILGNERISSIVPENFKSQKENLKSHKDSKKTYSKQLKQLRRELTKLNEDGRHACEDEDNEKKLLIQIEALEIKIKEEEIVIDEVEKEWNEAIGNYAKELLKKMRSRQLKPKIDDFVLFDKTTFKAGDLDSKVIEQLIKEDIAKHYKKKPADRNCIIEQLKGLLGNKLPKCIIRADIKGFFESVPMDKLLTKLEEEGYVSNITIGYLRMISYDVKRRGVDGLPRGLAYSSYLTEISLQKADDKIRNLPNLYFYQRYVDDIVMLFSVRNDTYPRYRINEGWRHWKSVKEIFNEEGLTLHEDNEKMAIIYSGKSNRNEFDYLGYKLIINAGELSVRLSSDRLEKYKTRISAVINHYNRTAQDNESLPDIPQSLPKGERRRKRQQPLRRLFGQLSALTGNGMLKGPKSNILTGVYYSNQYITSIVDLEELDEYLHEKINRSLRIPNNLFRYTEDCRPDLMRREIKDIIIKKWSFVDGFRNRRFCNNSSYFNRLKQIKELSE